MIKIAMVRMHAALRERRLQSRMLLQVHDELLFESPPEEVETITALAREIMEAALPLDVPIVVDVKDASTGRRCEPPVPAGRPHRRHRHRQVHRVGDPPPSRGRRHRRRSPRPRGGRAGSAGAGGIVQEFGREALRADGTLDRKRVAAIVFADPERRRKLEAITHPAIRDRFLARLAELEAQGFEGLVFWDAPVMIEAAATRPWTGWSSSYGQRHASSSEPSAATATAPTSSAASPTRWRSVRRPSWPTM